MDHLEPIAVFNLHIDERPARHHLKVALDGDPQRVEPELLQHLRDGDARGNPAGLAVDSDREALLRFDGH